MENHVTVDIDDGHESVNTDVSEWSTAQVKSWLRQNGYKEIENNLNNANHHITGKALLALSRDQLQQPPFHMTNMHEVDHLQSCIEILRKQQLTNYMNKGAPNGYHNASQVTALSNGLVSNGHAYENGNKAKSIHEYSRSSSPLLPNQDKDRASSVSIGDSFPVEVLKTFLSFLYMMLGFVVSVFMLQVVHERVPPMDVDPPLPDVFFDIVPNRVEWAFSICEWSGMILTFFTALVCVFHKYRFVITRRIFFIMGTLYYYRSITTYVTTLPVPGIHFKCAPKVDYKLSIMISRAVAVLSGGGLTVTGAHNYCGDYLFSGHTIILVMTYMTVAEYSPKRWWWLHWVSWLLAALGIICILLAHDHYTIDVVVAYLLTTRMFWTYHTMCNVNTLKELGKSNFLSRAWWFPIFRFFEGNVVSNGPLPRQYDWPLPWPKRFRQPLDHRRTLIKRV